LGPTPSDQEVIQPNPLTEYQEIIIEKNISFGLDLEPIMFYVYIEKYISITISLLVRADHDSL